MNPSKKGTIQRLRDFAKPCKGLLASSVALAALATFCGIIPYAAVSQIISNLMGGQIQPTRITPLVLLALLGYLASLWLNTYSTIRSHRAAFTILAHIRKAITAKLARMPMGTILDTPSGKYKSMLVDTVEKLELPLAHMVPELTANTLIPVLMLIYLFLLDWRIALISLATVPIGLLCYMGMMKDYEARYARVLSANKNMDAAMVEYINGIQVIKTFRQDEDSYRKYAAAVMESERSKSDWFRKTNGFYVAGMAVMPSCLLGVLPLGSWLYINGRIDADALISCIILALGLVKPLIQALRYTDSLAMVDATVQEIGKLLDLEEMNRPQKTVSLPNHEIAFQNVSFRYHETEVLHQLSFSCAEGAMTAIVGPSGSGKSTIARLIASFWEAESGCVTLGGVDMRKIPLSQAMNAVSYVSQDNFLFHLSIRENIRFGNPSATDEEVERAAQKASCHDFILSLPRGYDTLAGDGGSHLSGGERQRIAIARAILKNSPVVVLDEATAFADPENEAVIQSSISQLVAGKTLIVIAHRLSTITAADTIFVLNEGAVAAQGTHQELLAESPLYQALWQAHIGTKDKGEEEA